MSFFVFPFFVFHMNKTLIKKSIKSKLQEQVNFNICKGKTYIYACVKNIKFPSQNEFIQVDCKNLHPITSHIYNINTNTISVYCVSLELIGSVDFVLRFKLNNSAMPYINLPVPNNLIYSNLNLEAKNKYNVLKNKYKGKGLYKINFLQLIKL